MSRTNSLVRAAGLAALAFAACIAAAAQQESILYSFSPSQLQAVVPGRLMIDAAGNLYGTTVAGGSGACSLGNGCGTVFQLSPNATGWTETSLHNFSNTGTDGYEPNSGLAMDAGGNIYGTTRFGGTGACNNNTTCGTVFELTPQGDGSWTESILHNFVLNGKDGTNPYGGLTLDTLGNLYGTTQYGGTEVCPAVGYGCGVVFEVLPEAGGTWTEQVLHNFKDNGKDGFYPLGRLVLDASGNLYGISAGGVHSHGAIFKIAPKAGGGWMEQVLHSFAGGNDGYGPTDLAISAAGNLFGTTNQGGTATRCGKLGCGTIFEVSPATGGGWSERILHNFGKGVDGFYPVGLTIDSAGSLYGATESGGTGCTNAGCGTAFQLSSVAGGGWTEKVLYSFGMSNTDGDFPIGGVVLDAAGNLYGAADSGGSHGLGAIYKIGP